MVDAVPSPRRGFWRRMLVASVVLLTFFGALAGGALLHVGMTPPRRLIAAILTVLGYSINDTVIIFDRIREYLREKKALTLAGLFDDSISDTLPVITYFFCDLQASRHL